MLIIMFTLLFGCSDETKTEPFDSVDTGLPTDTAEGTDTNETEDTDVVEVDPIEEGRTATTICSAGGHVDGSSISGSFCFGAVDISPSPKATSASFQWQPGPYTAVSP